MVYVLLESLTNKRVKQLNGCLTPVFDYPRQALNYSKAKGMVNARVVKTDKFKKD